MEVCILYIYESIFVFKRKERFLFLGFTQPFGGTAAAPVQQVAQPANVVRPDDLLITSLTSPRLFNDERDELLLKWNILQVFYGTGKTFCYQGNYNYYKKNEMYLIILLFRYL